MDSIRIRGGRPLEGEIEIFGAKNAALPLMAASLLTDETLTLSNIPHLTDITTLVHLLAQHGVEIGMDGNARRGGNAGRVLSLRARQIHQHHGALRAGEPDACLHPGAGAAARPHGAGDRLAPRRLRHRHPPRRSAYRRAHPPRRPGRSRRRRHQRACTRAAARGRDQAALRFGGCDREPDDGGDACGRRDGHPQRSARAGNRRSRPLPERDGRGHQRGRQRRARDPGPGGALRHRPPRGRRQNRGRHLRTGRCHRRRRCGARRCAVGAPALFARLPGGRRRYHYRDATRAQGAGQRPADGDGRDDAALSRLSPPTSRRRRWR